MISCVISTEGYLSFCDHRFQNIHLSRIQSEQMSLKQLMECMSSFLLIYWLNQANICLRFLLARLHMDALMSQPTLGHIKRTLQILPEGIEGLDKVYEQAMGRIRSQEDRYRELAIQVLTWITYSKRALSPAEVQHAYAVAVADASGVIELDKDFLPELEILGSVCAGLIVLNERSNTIRLVHSTAREYLHQVFQSANTETDITKACVAYLSFDTFATGFLPSDDEFEARLERNPLYSYAARNWGYHARRASTDEGCILGILDLLGSGAKVSASSQAMLVSGSYPGYSQRVP